MIQARVSARSGGSPPRADRLIGLGPKGEGMCVCVCVCEWELDSETRVENSLAKLCGIVNRRMCRGRVRSSLRCSIRSSLEQRLKLSRPDNGGRQDHVGLASRVYPALVLPVASFVAPRVEGKFRSKEEVKQFDFSIYRDCYEAVRFSFFVDRFEFFLFFFFFWKEF